MRVQFKDRLVIISAEGDDDRDALARLAHWAGFHVFALHAHGDKGCAFEDLGPRETACREAINITSSVNEAWRPISNLAYTPFELDGFALRQH